MARSPMSLASHGRNVSGRDFQIDDALGGIILTPIQVKKSSVRMDMEDDILERMVDGIDCSR
jgi:hypothetical protein